MTPKFDFHRYEALDAPAERRFLINVITTHSSTKSKDGKALRKPRRFSNLVYGATQEAAEQAAEELLILQWTAQEKKYAANAARIRGAALARLKAPAGERIRERV